MPNRWGNFDWEQGTMAGRLGTAILIAVTAWLVVSSHQVLADESAGVLASIPSHSPHFPPRDFRPRERFAPPPGDHPRPPRPDQVVTPAGYIFLNGKYIEPPYSVSVRDNQIVVNDILTGIELTEAMNRPGDSYPEERRGDRHPGRRFGRGWHGPRLPPEFTQLEYGSVVVLFENTPPVALEFAGMGKAFLKALNDPAKRGAFLADEGEICIPPQERERWQSWITSFTSPTTLRTRSEFEITELETELAKSETQANAYHALEKWNFPLTIGCVVLVLAACGHLLFSAPFRGLEMRWFYSWSQPLLPLALSLGFVFILSALDLLWTVLMSQAGLMEEANPLARLFIDDPTQLAAFKSIFTVGAIAIIGGLHRFRPAHVGAWWACLICTLLATRWVVFHTLAV